MNNLKILFASHVDANDKMAMAGIPYHMGCALQRHCGTVDVVSPVDDAIIRKGIMVRRFSRVFGQRRDSLGNSMVSKLIANNIHIHTRDKQYDFVFVGYGHTVAAHLKPGCPVVYASDTTYSQISSYYNFGNSPTERIWRENNSIEQRSIDNASLLIYPSRFAASSAITDYGASPEKVHVVPFGANLALVPDTETINQAIQTKVKAGICRMLFIGRDWNRKGGKIALEAFHILSRMNIPAEITFVGSQPPELSEIKGVTFIPSLNKNIPADAKVISDLLLSATFFLLPTRAEQFGIVFSEASAFGVPSITTNTGGVGSAVEDGVNGYKLPLEAEAGEYAKCIAHLFNNKIEYCALSTSSRARYDALLNWDSWGKSIFQLLTSS